MENGLIGEVIRNPEARKDIRHITKTHWQLMKYNRQAEVRTGDLDLSSRIMLHCVIAGFVLLYDLWNSHWTTRRRRQKAVPRTPSCHACTARRQDGSPV